jgi:hypothetical protein
LARRDLERAIIDGQFSSSAIKQPRPLNLAGTHIAIFRFIVETSFPLRKIEADCRTNPAIGGDALPRD